MIPKIIHFVWFGTARPEWVERNISAFRAMNPDYDVMVHDEGVLDVEKYGELFDRLPSRSDQSDLLRYSALQKWGGWYVDCDMFPLRPLSDAERAWNLDGSKLFCGAQSPESKDHWLNGAILCVEKGWAGWEKLDVLITRRGWQRFGDCGPQLITAFGRENPSLVEIADKPWFYGTYDHRWHCKIYEAVIRGRLDVARRWMPETGGQLPYVLHLWNYRFEKEIGQCAAKAAPVALVYDRPVWAPVQAEAFAALCDGLRAADIDVVTAERKWNDLCGAIKKIPNYTFIWNGIRETERKIVNALRQFGSKIFFVEHGFFDRNHYVQVDHKGTQHRAAWAKRLTEPAPACGAERLARFYPDGIKPMRAKRDGYILVLGQVPNDSQLWDSAIQTPEAIQAITRASLARDIPVYFRPHPKRASVRTQQQILPVLNPAGKAEAAAYETTKHGAGLEAALAGARFVITINSTAGNEALAAGVPVLAFGPALYTAGGVAKQTSRKTFKDDLRAMLEGWMPEQSAVDNYMNWLAARQYNAEDLADGDVVAEILEASRE